MKPLESLDLEQPLPTLWPRFDGLRDVPLLIIRGANSDLLSAGTLREMAGRHKGAEILIVEGQGHAPLLLDEETINRICTFVAAADSAAREDRPRRTTSSRSTSGTAR
jgi:pimeloyl-ACP methyl ester carboxylesterase